ncbi:MAG TPA: IS110 family transposase [Candidatus Dormibacteraeota bacterium]
MIYLGIDWAEAHHDVCLLDEGAGHLAKARVPDGLEGLARIHELVGEHTTNPETVVVGIETDRGLLVQGLVATGYRVYALNPFAVSRYRDRHTVSRAKSDAGDAKVLAELVRTDRQNHRPVAGDSELAEALKVLARSHQTLIWARGRHVNQLRSALREFYPAAQEALGTELAGRDALALLSRAPTPEQGSRLTLSQLRNLLLRAGRQRGVDARTRELQHHLRTPQLRPPSRLSKAYGSSVLATVRVIAELNHQIAGLEAEIAAAFEDHPDAKILRSLPGLGVVLGARVLAEFGDDRTRFQDARARRCYAGCAPITRASGTRLVVLARIARNRRLADALYLWAFCALTQSPGARAYYKAHRARGHTHHQALRALANRLVGILHGCLEHCSMYAETIAWPSAAQAAA